MHANRQNHLRLTALPHAVSNEETGQLKESSVTLDVPHFRKRQTVNATPGQAQHVKFADTAGKTLFTIENSE